MCTAYKYIWISFDRVSFYTCNTLCIAVGGGGSVRSVCHLHSIQGKPFGMTVCPLAISSSISQRFEKYLVFFTFLCVKCVFFLLVHINFSTFHFNSIFYISY
jgi:hypothetical protein